MIDFLKYLIKTSLLRFSEKTKKKSSQKWDYDDNHDDETFFNYLNKEKNIEKESDLESDFLNYINSTTTEEKKILEEKIVIRQEKQNAFYRWFDSIDSKEYMTIEGHILEWSEMSLKIKQFFIDNYYFAPKASSEAVGKKSKSDMLYFVNKSLHYKRMVAQENIEFKLKYPRLEKLIEILEKQHLPNWFLRNYSVLKKGDYIALNSGEKISLTNKELSMFNFLIEVIDNNSFSHNSNSKKIKKRYSLGMLWMKNNNCDAHNHIKSYFNSKF